MNYAYLNVPHRTTSYSLIIFNTQYIYIHVHCTENVLFSEILYAYKYCTTQNWQFLTNAPKFYLPTILS